VGYHTGAGVHPSTRPYRGAVEAEERSVGVRRRTLHAAAAGGGGGDGAAARDDLRPHQVRFYDDRGGGIETSFKDDKQGLGLTKRSKKRFEAQQMVVLLGALAHNVIVWARRWLAPHEPKVRRYGMKRMVRDIFHLSGFLVHNGRGRLVEVVLNQRAPLVRGIARSLDLLLRPSRIAVNWGQS
jgi:hypothetical protein